jgi:predicted nucleic acid-binding protein
MLVDTSIWIDHLRSGEPELGAALEQSLVVTHPFVVGELACGSIANRSEVLTLLARLSMAPVAAHDEVLSFIEAHSLMGRGIGYIDAHLLASAALSGDALLWTREGRLAALARELRLEYVASR